MENFEIRIDKDKTLEVGVEDSISIHIPVDVYYELTAYVDMFDTEVSGLGIVEKKCKVVETGVRGFSVQPNTRVLEYWIEKVFLPEQHNTAATTEISSESMHTLMYEAIQQGFDVANIKLHWHSHGSMNTFHSVTDEENYAEQNNGDFLVSLVLNKKGDILGRIDIYNPLHLSITNVKVVVVGDISDEKATEIRNNASRVKALDVKPTWPTTDFGCDDTDWIMDSSGFWKRKDHCVVDDTTAVTKDVKDTNTAKSEIRKFLGITRKEAASFENCMLDTNCSKCLSEKLCTAYLDAIGAVHMKS